ncbi:hypothetical protein GH714_030296 [Hevea brasiliensis]|uniref:Uncharacterized protein n=1 Tax=Hevea brasiliensis TaxID=3981 RepID=A0A6A6LFJ4_HEVBR|nr:hypothetical protein GH714_030296 [Hevea brasiliensis]
MGKQALLLFAVGLRVLAHYMQAMLWATTRIVHSYTFFDDLAAQDAGGLELQKLGQGSYYASAHKFLARSFVNGRHWIAPSDA